MEWKKYSKINPVYIKSYECPICKKQMEAKHHGVWHLWECENQHKLAIHK